MTWHNRIVEYVEVDPADLCAHPANAKLHPGRQAEVMRAVLDDVGWIAPVVENVTTGFIIDGHLRVAEALSAGIRKIPVVRVELTEAEEVEALVTHDAVGQLARWEKDRLDDLLADIETDSAAVDELLQDLHGVTPAEMPEIPEPRDEIVPEMRSLCAVFPYERYREVCERLALVPGDTVGQKLLNLLDRFG